MEEEIVNKILKKSESTLLNNYINKLRKQLEQTEELAMMYKEKISEKNYIINKAIKCIEDNMCGGSISNAREVLNIFKGVDSI